MTYADRADFAKRLKRWRLRRGWSFKRMSAFTRVAVGALWQCENDMEHDPSEHTLFRLEEAIPEVFGKQEAMS